MQTDPAGDGLNPYLYAAGNPVNAIDPDGLCALRMVGGVADIAAGAALVGVTTGWGSVVAWGLIANGFDNLVAGARSLDGDYKQAGLEWLIHRASPNPLVGNLAYTGTQLGLGYAGIRVYRGTAAFKRAAMINANRARTAALREKFGPISTQQLHQRINLNALRGAAAAARRAGIDMRMFELQYDRLYQGFGYIQKWRHTGGLYRAPNGRIWLALTDRALRSPLDSVATIAHELNHVRGIFRTGIETAEDVAEAAAKLASMYFRH